MLNFYKLLNSLESPRSNDLDFIENTLQGNVLQSNSGSFCFKYLKKSNKKNSRKKPFKFLFQTGHLSNSSLTLNALFTFYTAQNPRDLPIFSQRRIAPYVLIKPTKHSPLISTNARRLSMEPPHWFIDTSVTPT